MAEKTFSSLGRIEAVKQLFEGTGYQAFNEPLWLETKDGDCVTTASGTFLEGIDFNLVYFPLKHLGYKSVIAVTGELYAVMASPVTLSVVIAVSAKLDYEQISELWGGVVAAAKEQGYKSLSLQLQASKNGLCISMAATGKHSGFVSASRPGAHSKDLICISGNLGAAYLGQQVLEHRPEEIEKHKMLLAAYLKPELNPHTVAQLQEAGCFPSMGYFVSKGLSDAILRLCRDSGLGAKVYADKIPFEGGSFAVGKELDIDPISAAMNGGDDYRLLFTIPILKLESFRTEFQTFDIIGHLARPEVGAVLVSPDGLEHTISAPGWMTE